MYHFVLELTSKYFYLAIVFNFYPISLSFRCDLGESFNSESTQHKSAKFVLEPSCFSDRTQMQHDVRFLIILSN